MNIFIKLLLSASIIYIVNEIVIAKSNPIIGSMIASLPFVSIITFVWIWKDPRIDTSKRVDIISNHSLGIFWFVLASLPMFLIFPWLLKKDISFFLSLIISSFSTVFFYYIILAFFKK